MFNSDIKYSEFIPGSQQHEGPTLTIGLTNRAMTEVLYVRFIPKDLFNKYRDEKTVELPLIQLINKELESGDNSIVETINMEA